VIVIESAPVSQSGCGFILPYLWAETHGLIVGVTACSAEMSNNYSFKPIDVEIYAE